MGGEKQCNIRKEKLCSAYDGQSSLAAKTDVDSSYESGRRGDTAGLVLGQGRGHVWDEAIIRTLASRVIDNRYVRDVHVVLNCCIW